MPPTTTKPGTPKIAFLLNEQRFRQLVALIQGLTSTDDLEYIVRLSDGSSITCESADEVLGVQNSRERRITSIWIDTSYRSEPRIRVRFQSRFYLEPVEYEVSGNEKDVFHASARLDEYFSGLRLWYSPMVSLGFKIYGVYAIIVILLSLLVQDWLTRLANANEVALDIEASLLLSLLVTAVLTIICFPVLERLRTWLLPNGTFAIGDGLDRQNNLVRTRRVIGGAILTLVLGAVGFWLYPLLL